jgi:hypothetical protein
LTDDAARDLSELYEYISSHDSPGKTDNVLDRIEKTLRLMNKLGFMGELGRIGIPVINLDDDQIMDDGVPGIPRSKKMRQE